MKHRNIVLALTTAVLALAQTAAARSIGWEPDGANPDWNTPGSWSKGTLPGAERPDIAVFAGPMDKGAINSTVRSKFPVDVTMRNSASLLITADAEDLRSIRLASTLSQGTATLMHSAGTVTASGFLVLGEMGSAVYSISGPAVLNLAGKVIVYDSGMFSLTGARASVTVGDSGLSLEGAGELQFTFDANGIGSIASSSEFSVDRAASKLTIDASAFEGIGSFDLVTFDSMDGRGFAEKNVSITGLGAERTGSISYDQQRMNLDITVKPGAKGHYVDIPEPGAYTLFAGLAMIAYVLVGRRR